NLSWQSIRNFEENITGGKFDGHLAISYRYPFSRDTGTICVFGPKQFPALYYQSICTYRWGFVLTPQNHVSLL
ncbi:MAG TPA: hypothetical protein VJK09_01105, partial [Candidatus Paceibacterota bacterium]